MPNAFPRILPTLSHSTVSPSSGTVRFETTAVLSRAISTVKRSTTRTCITLHQKRPAKPVSGSRTSHSQPNFLRAANVRNISSGLSQDPTFCMVSLCCNRVLDHESEHMGNPAYMGQSELLCCLPFDTPEQGGAVIAVTRRQKVSCCEVTCFVHLTC